MFDELKLSSHYQASQYFWRRHYLSIIQVNDYICEREITYIKPIGRFLPAFWCKFTSADSSCFISPIITNFLPNLLRMQIAIHILGGGGDGRAICGLLQGRLQARLHLRVPTRLHLRPQNAAYNNTIATISTGKPGKEIELFFFYICTLYNSVIVFVILSLHNSWK